MRFKVDEDLPPFVAAQLREAGFDAVTVADQGLTGTADEHLVPTCREESRILVTLDLDFSDIRTHPPGSGPGFVVMRLDRQDRSDFEVATRLLLRALARDSVDGNLWIVEPDRVRVREPEPLPEP